MRQMLSQTISQRKREKKKDTVIKILKCFLAPKVIIE